MHTTNYIMRMSMSTSDQKLYTEFWLSPLSFCFWLDGINSRFKRYLDNKSKERTRVCNQRVRESRCRRIKTIDKDILITYRFSDRKFLQPIITTSELPQEQGIRNNSASSLFHKHLTNVMWMKSSSKTAEMKFIEVFYVFLDHNILFDNFC